MQVYVRLKQGRWQSLPKSLLFRRQTCPIRCSLSNRSPQYHHTLNLPSANWRLKRDSSTGPSCSKLTMSFAKGTCIFFSKNTLELDIVLTRTVNILTINELVQLTMLWTTGPRTLFNCFFVLIQCWRAVASLTFLWQCSLVKAIISMGSDCKRSDGKPKCASHQNESNCTASRVFVRYWFCPDDLALLRTSAG